MTGNGISAEIQQLISQYTVAVRIAHTSSILKEPLEKQRVLYEAQGVALGKLQIAIAAIGHGKIEGEEAQQLWKYHNAEEEVNLRSYDG